MTAFTPVNPISGASLDIAADHRAKLKALFPLVFTETRSENGEVIESVDFEKLKAELGNFTDLFESRRERYGMEWPGKKDALKLIQTPTYGTLTPARDESVNFDTTGNLFIEGDNLEVLKILQKSYYGKVKMIYIDPPYNTGKEFIYPDNFTESLETYLAYSGQLNENGQKYATNNANEGRFHTKWLNMMYPRLYLARNLLNENGVLFASIDENEVDNLKRLLMEVFGEENFVGMIAVQVNPRGRHLDEFIARTHEYVLIAAKNVLADDIMVGFDKEGRMLEAYNQEDDRGKYRELGLRNRNQAFNPKTRPSLFFPLFVNRQTGKVSLEKSADFAEEVLPITADGVSTCWTWGKEKVSKEAAKLIAHQMEDQSWRIFRKDYLHSEDGAVATTLPKSIWLDKELNNDYGRKAMKDLFGKPLMDFPKPPALIKKLIALGAGEGDIVLDFFSGSSTTAHAVLEQNMEQEAGNQFIMVQLPEPVDATSDASKEGLCLLYTSPSPRDGLLSRMPSSA